MLQTLDRERPRSLPLASSSVSKGDRSLLAQVRSAATSTRHWTWLEAAQEDLGCQRYDAGRLMALIDLFSADGLVPWVTANEAMVEDSAHQALPYRECARLVAQHLALNKSDLAKLFSISRPTLYSWISGEAEPREEGHRQRLFLLGRIASELFRPLYHRFVYERMPNETLSIYQALEAGSWDEALVKRLFRKAEVLTAMRDEDLGMPPRLSGAAQEQNLEDNLQSLGGL